MRVGKLLVLIGVLFLLSACNQVEVPQNIPTEYFGEKVYFSVNSSTNSGGGLESQADTICSAQAVLVDYGVTIGGRIELRCPKMITSGNIVVKTANTTLNKYASRTVNRSNFLTIFTAGAPEIVQDFKTNRYCVQGTIKGFTLTDGSRGVYGGVQPLNCVILTR